MEVITQAGFVEISSDDYHADKDHVGHSALVKILRSPGHYRDAADRPREQTDDMAFGHAFHTRVLEPHKFGSQYDVIDEEALKGALVSLDDYKAAAAKLEITVGKMKKDELKAAIQAKGDPNFKFREDLIVELYGNKTIISADEMFALDSMAGNLQRHTELADFFSHGMAEMSGFWTDPETGIRCKFRPDWIALTPHGNFRVMVDAKKTRDASKEGFRRSISNFGYDVQAAFYTDGFKALTGETIPFYFAAAEDRSPFAVAGYRATESMIETGRAKYRAALQLLNWCRENAAWPTYQPFGQCEEIDLPRWDTFSLEA